MIILNCSRHWKNNEKSVVLVGVIDPNCQEEIVVLYTTGTRRKISRTRGSVKETPKQDCTLSSLGGHINPGTQRGSMTLPPASQ